MNHNPKSMRLANLSTGAYKILLYAYPTSFRLGYGEAMAQVFRDCCLRAARQGTRPVRS